MGFEKGLSYWKRFLKDGSCLALTEANLFAEKPSEEVLQFWQECYPDIKTIPENEKNIKNAGYSVVESFKLPESAWTDDFYVPLENRLNEIEAGYSGNN